MSVVAAITHNEYWAAAASAAGPAVRRGRGLGRRCSAAPGSATFHAVEPRRRRHARANCNDAYAIPLMVLQNERDCTVLRQAGAQPARRAPRGVRRRCARHAGRGARATQRACTPAFGERPRLRARHLHGRWPRAAAARWSRRCSTAARSRRRNPQRQRSRPLLDRRRTRPRRQVVAAARPELSRHRVGLLCAPCARSARRRAHAANHAARRQPDAAGARPGLHRSRRDRYRCTGRQRAR